MLLTILPPQHVVDSVVAIAAAYVLALPIGWERKTRGTMHVGLRTIPLVSVGSCAYLLITRYLFELGVYDSDGLARNLRAMMTGIGFIGGGAILKRRKDIRGVAGVTTAASVWASGAVGASVAHGYYVIAVALTIMELVVIFATEKLAAASGMEREEESDTRDAEQP